MFIINLICFGYRIRVYVVIVIWSFHFMPDKLYIARNWRVTMNKEQGYTVGLRTLEDISSLILHSHDLQETLDNIVNLVAKRMGVPTSAPSTFWKTMAKPSP